MDRKRRKNLSREMLGFALLGLLLAVSLIASRGMCRRHEEIARKLDTAVAFALAGDWEQTQAATASAREQWDAGWRLSGLLADLSPMEQIDIQFAQLSVWEQVRQEAEFAAAGAALSRQIRTMGDAHRLTWWNLL